MWMTGMGATYGRWYSRSVESMEKTTLYLPGELQHALRELARREGRSQAAIVREAVERYIAGAEKPAPRSLGAFTQDPGRGARVPARGAKRWVRERWTEQANDRAQARPRS